MQKAHLKRIHIHIYAQNFVGMHIASYNLKGKNLLLLNPGREGIWRANKCIMSLLYLISFPYHGWWEECNTQSRRKEAASMARADK